MHVAELDLVETKACRGSSADALVIKRAEHAYTKAQLGCMEFSLGEAQENLARFREKL